MAENFKVHEGSRYVVLMTEKRSEIISSDQMKRLVHVLNDATIVYVNVNDRIVKRNTIIDISPLKHRPEDQKFETPALESGKRRPIKKSFCELMAEHADKLKAIQRENK